MEEERPKLALLDLMLPDADGVELMQAILEIDDVPVTFISACGWEELSVTEKLRTRIPFYEPCEPEQKRTPGYN